MLAGMHRSEPNDLEREIWECEIMKGSSIVILALLCANCATPLPESEESRRDFVAKLRRRIRGASVHQSSTVAQRWQKDGGRVSVQRFAEAREIDREELSA